MLTALLALAGPTAADDFCMDCLSIRLDPPQVVRGPFPDEIDNAFAMLRLEDGTWRGFSANGATYAIDGTSITDMGGKRRAVLKPGPKGSATECGRWLSSSCRSATYSMASSIRNPAATTITARPTSRWRWPSPATTG